MAETSARRLAEIVNAAGTLTVADDGISGDKINGGTISDFSSTGIDDNATGNVMTIDSIGNVVFNEDSNDRDFRVETNDNTHTFFINGGANYVRIGSNGAYIVSVIKTRTVAGNSSGYLDFDFSSDFGGGATPYFLMEFNGSYYGDSASGSGLLKASSGGYSNTNGIIATAYAMNSGNSWSVTRPSSDVYRVTLTNSHANTKYMLVKATATFT